MASICVYLENGPKGLSKPSLEALGEARRRADEGGGSVTVLLFGQGLDEAAAMAGRHGADKVIVADEARFADFNLAIHFQAALKALDGAGADYLFMPVSTHTRELASQLAARFDSGLAMDVTAIAAEGDTLSFTRPIHAG